MGVVKENAEFLCRAALAGVSFKRMLTLGHQSLYLDKNTIEYLAKRYAVKDYPADLHKDAYADRFFASFLGAEKILSLDNSDYENAGLVHDLNLPLGQEYEQSFDVVFDGGSLEHVFNFPVAISNCMRLLSIGGSFLSCTIGNNGMGHGFYQFSPELFYRTFSEKFGFRTNDVLALESHYLGGEHGARGPIYRVADPDILKSRVTLVGTRPLSLLVHAKKTQHLASPFRDGFPQQSDYATLWMRGHTNVAADATLIQIRSSPFRTVAKKVFSILPAGLKRWVRLKREAYMYSIHNKHHFIRQNFD